MARIESGRSTMTPGGEDIICTTRASGGRFRSPRGARNRSSNCRVRPGHELPSRKRSSSGPTGSVVRARSRLRRKSSRSRDRSTSGIPSRSGSHGVTTGFLMDRNSYTLMGLVASVIGTLHGKKATCHGTGRPAARLRLKPRNEGSAELEGTPRRVDDEANAAAEPLGGRDRVPVEQSPIKPRRRGRPFDARQVGGRECSSRGRRARGSPRWNQSRGPPRCLQTLDSTGAGGYQDLRRMNEASSGSGRYQAAPSYVSPRRAGVGDDRPTRAALMRGTNSGTRTDQHAHPSPSQAECTRGTVQVELGKRTAEQPRVFEVQSSSTLRISESVMRTTASPGGALQRDLGNGPAGRYRRGNAGEDENPVPAGHPAVEGRLFRAGPTRAEPSAQAPEPSFKRKASGRHPAVRGECLSGAFARGRDAYLHSPRLRRGSAPGRDREAPSVRERSGMRLREVAHAAVSLARELRASRPGSRPGPSESQGSRRPRDFFFAWSGLDEPSHRHKALAKAMASTYDAMAGEAYCPRSPFHTGA